MLLRYIVSKSWNLFHCSNLQCVRTFLRKPSNRCIYSQANLCYPRKPPGSSNKDLPPIALNVTEKYKVFDDKDAVIIENTSEEILAEELDDDDFDEFEGLTLERGVTGVFEIDELVNILKQENAKDIFVVALPSNIRFSDYICIVTGRSSKHNFAIAEFLRKLYKRKKNPRDVIPKIEGKGFKDWIALDLGNIILHIFLEDIRKQYDLELLWSVGAEYDDLSRKYSESMEIIKKHSIYLEDLIPAEDK